MEAFPTDNVEVLDVQGKKIVQYCLGLPTILRQILEQVSNEQLMQLSLVNKLWNFEARSVLRARGTLKVYFSRGSTMYDIDEVEDCLCQELEDFASDVDKMRVVPFSGIHFPIGHRVVCKSLSKRSLQPSHKIILDRLHWKHFKVEFGYNYWMNYKDCPALLLIKQILEDFGGVLEELTFSFASEQFLGPIFKYQTLPRLRYLTIHSWEVNSADGTLPSTFIKKLVSCAPNLQELHVNEPVDLWVNLLEGSSAVLVPNFILSPLFVPICQDLISSIRSATMAILIPKEQIDPELLSRSIPKLLEASRTTLKTLIIDYLFAVPLMCYGICLEN